MRDFKIQIRVNYKEGILDPQAGAILSALHKLQFKTVEQIECDKFFVLKLKAENEASAVDLGRQMANQLLANVVMENFEVEVVK